LVKVEHFVGEKDIGASVGVDLGQRQVSRDCGLELLADSEMPKLDHLMFALYFGHNPTTASLSGSDRSCATERLIYADNNQSSNRSILLGVGSFSRNGK
jgi:hypothetical protein